MNKPQKIAAIAKTHLRENFIGWFLLKRGKNRQFTWNRSEILVYFRGSIAEFAGRSGKEMVSPDYS
jgi:hypothetical protein